MPRQDLGHELHLLQPLLNALREDAPGLALPCIEPLPVVALAEQQEHKHPVAAPNVDKSGKFAFVLLQPRHSASEAPPSAAGSTVAVHVAPELDEEGCDAKILEDMLGRVGNLGPGVHEG